VREKRVGTLFDSSLYFVVEHGKLGKGQRGGFGSCSGSI
jgi:hypothetical protein